MGKFDFLENMGESKSNFTIKPSTKSENEKISLLEILKSRNLIGAEFKDELISLLVNKKIDFIIRMSKTCYKKSISESL